MEGHQTQNEESIRIFDVLTPQVAICVECLNVRT
jgi:hypothetical protein